MLACPETLEEFAKQSPQLVSLWVMIREMAEATREMLGEERLAWLRGLPRVQKYGSMALVHASPESLWRAPMPEATDAELERIYGPLRAQILVYAHIHRPYIRSVSETIVVNTGSVGLPCDGDPRTASLLLDESTPTIRRVEYDVEQELKALSGCGLPHTNWVAKMLQSATAQMP